MIADLWSCDWHGNHAILFNKRNWIRPTATKLATFAKGLKDGLARRMFSALPLRCKEIVFYYAKVVAQEKLVCELVIDVSQCGLRSCPKQDALGCFTGTSMLWMVQAQRLVTGLEMLAVQGLTEARIAGIRDVKDSCLANFAGNSFSAVCMSHAFVSTGSA